MSPSDSAAQPPASTNAEPTKTVPSQSEPPHMHSASTSLQNNSQTDAVSACPLQKSTLLLQLPCLVSTPGLCCVVVGRGIGPRLPGSLPGTAGQAFLAWPRPQLVVLGVVAQRQVVRLQAPRLVAGVHHHWTRFLVVVGPFPVCRVLVKAAKQYSCTGCQSCPGSFSRPS